MTIDGLVNEQGPLAETFAKLDPSSIQHSDEICADRISDKDLRNKWFWTADGAVYTVENDEVILYLTRREENPVINNIKEAIDQLIQTQNYVPKQEDLEAAINSKNTLRIKLSDLDIIKDNDEHSHFEINTSEYNKLNETQRALCLEKVTEGDAQESKSDPLLTSYHLRIIQQKPLIE
ncbi:MAG: hypothetical protein NT001_07085 [Candidatus Woesearchaeota archaeon]|nr:hypothetical protein [Candidatus Woesearchaeota archaeon]